MPVAGWFLTANTIYGLWYLEGQTVAVLTDGGQHANQVVTNGSINLQYEAGVVQVGLPYIGLIKTMQVEGTRENVDSSGKSKNVNRLAVTFLNSLSAKYGTSLYNLQDFDFRSISDMTGRPSPPFSNALVIIQGNGLS